MRDFNELVKTIYCNTPSYNITPATLKQVQTLQQRETPADLLVIAYRDKQLASWLIGRRFKNEVDYLKVLYELAIIRRADNKFLDSLKTLIEALEVFTNSKNNRTQDINYLTQKFINKWRCKDD